MDKELKEHLIKFLTNLTNIEIEEIAGMDDLCTICFDEIENCGECHTVLCRGSNTDYKNDFDEKEREYLLKELLWLKDKKC